MRGRRARRRSSFNETDIADKPAWLRSWKIKSSGEIALIDDAQRARLEMLLSVDEMVGSLLETLRETDALENTYVIFASENGFHLGEHRLWAKRTPYEESIWVPLIVHGPGVPAGEVRDELVLNTDLAPTIAGWAGVAVPEFVDGRSLAPLLAEEEPAAWRRAALVEVFPKATLERPSPAPATPDPDAVRIRTYLPSPPFNALRTGDLIYIEYESGERELYNLETDPYQLENLAATADPSELDRLSEWLASLADCQAEGCRAAEDGPPGS